MCKQPAPFHNDHGKSLNQIADGSSWLTFVGQSANTRKIRNFSIPAKKAVTSLLLVLPACYAAASTVVEPPAQFPGLFNIANTYIRPMVGDSVLKGLGLFILVVHALESLYTAKILWKHVSSPLIGVRFCFELHDIPSSSTFIT